MKSQISRISFDAGTDIIEELLEDIGCGGVMVLPDPPPPEDFAALLSGLVVPTGPDRIGARGIRPELVLEYPGLGRLKYYATTKKLVTECDVHDGDCCLTRTMVASQRKGEIKSPKLYGQGRPYAYAVCWLILCEMKDHTDHKSHVFDWQPPREMRRRMREFLRASPVDSLHHKFMDYEAPKRSPGDPDEPDEV